MHHPLVELRLRNDIKPKAAIASGHSSWAGLLFGTSLILAGCSGGAVTSEQELVRSVGQSVIVGEDDRLDVFELDDEALANHVTQSVAAVMYAQNVRLGGGSAEVVAPTLGEALDLCDSEPFREQPSAARCSGTLIDDDLLLTAGHCLGYTDEETARLVCAQLRIVFDYYLASAGAEPLIEPDDVFSCKSVVVYQKEAGNPDAADFAVVQLDRPATPERLAVSVQSARPEVGDLLTAATHGAGLPLKVQLGVGITEVDDGQFLTAETDSFAGGSGGALFDRELSLVAIQARGLADWQYVEGCGRAVRVEQTSEQHQFAVSAVEAVCDAGWPSPRLCGTEPRCGDTICSPGEACPSDCPKADCGDALCERREYDTCAADCNLFDDVPADWEQLPATYQSPESDSESEDPARETDGSGCRFARTPASAPTPPLTWLLIALVLFCRRKVAQQLVPK